MRMQMRILHFNIREYECEYFFHFYVYYFMTCDINWRSFWIFSEIDEPLDFNETMRTNIVINVVS